MVSLVTVGRVSFYISHLVRCLSAPSMAEWMGGVILWVTKRCDSRVSMYPCIVSYRGDTGKLPT